MGSKLLQVPLQETVDKKGPFSYVQSDIIEAQPSKPNWKWAYQRKGLPCDPGREDYSIWTQRQQFWANEVKSSSIFSIHVTSYKAKRWRHEIDGIYNEPESENENLHTSSVSIQTLQAVSGMFFFGEFYRNLKYGSGVLVRPCKRTHLGSRQRFQLYLTKIRNN